MIVMKHEQVIRSVITLFHQPWMGEQDKKDFDDEIIKLFGERFDADIEVGITNGYTPEQQGKIILEVLKLNNKVD